jgi:phosphoribosylglycinamide formyltransferase-1
VDGHELVAPEDGRSRRRTLEQLVRSGAWYRDTRCEPADCRADVPVCVRKGVVVAQLRVAVLVSHTGSNLRALHEASRGADAGFTVGLVVSNNSGSQALAYARDWGIPGRHMSLRTHATAEELDAAMLDELVARGIGLVVTAGYMKKLGPRTLAGYENRVINIHPSLLPRHGGRGMFGLAVHQAVLPSWDRVTGASIHYVTAEYDAGEVIARHEVPVLPEDTAESLAARVLAAEHQLLPEVVKRIAARLDRED